ncbi:hypothetical protein AVEN_224132-1 [Araneus ventricosus]|uniref:Secreted protein n=1 Tax=Araneus ventricosus TaxID=182803 RepID=A0A4Y2IEL5_ARAVE|nr:hypothetical protein AVEN_224132-1 [Araneus ventricosus]
MFLAFIAASLLTSSVSPPPNPQSPSCTSGYAYHRLGVSPGCFFWMSKVLQPTSSSTSGVRVLPQVGEPWSRLLFRMSKVLQPTSPIVNPSEVRVPQAGGALVQAAVSDEQQSVEAN